MAKAHGVIVEVNGAEIYHEVRGAGPTLLFISGSTGDAGHLEQVANELQDEFTVVTYGRRGNSRSRRLEGWDRTSVDEQADDAAGLIEALDGAAALVYGNSTGAIIALNLLIRHPALVRGAMLHEPPLLSVLARPEDHLRPFQYSRRGPIGGGADVLYVASRRNRHQKADCRPNQFRPSIGVRNSENYYHPSAPGCASTCSCAGRRMDVFLEVLARAGSNHVATTWPWAVRGVRRSAPRRQTTARR